MERGTFVSICDRQTRHGWWGQKPGTSVGKVSQKAWLRTSHFIIKTVGAMEGSRAGMMTPKRIRSWVYRAAVKNQDKAVGLQKGVDLKL